MNAQLTPDQMRAVLQQAFAPTLLEIIDDEKQHASHAHHGAGHFRLMIRSPAFQGKTRIQMHRMIYAALEPYLGNGIHALSIDAKGSSDA
ncbi:DNA-binding transcriptional regulator BolA [Saezia sanguinis]|uniref:DNA-binding transcriptional regulator BolA n=1 Tax=Saezia sanguinis TaxID=1965230 RepID=A0A433SH01_9BURK|nr:BolA family protein [Saezia sanguinis]RUS68023.1 DNA-binding transcriptional regulator BolA [Saezia sanguinis]